MAAGPADDLPQQLPGRVVERDGRPVAGALVVIVESTVPMPELAIQCDDAGRFAVGLLDGRFPFRAHAPDARSGEATVERPRDPDIRVTIADGA